MTRNALSKCSWLLTGSAVAAALSLASREARAQSTMPLLPVEPYDWAPPTPTAPPPEDASPQNVGNTIAPITVPPFVEPLPPAVNFPPPIPVPEAVTPPGPCGPFANNCRELPGPQAPNALPEQAFAPDMAEAPAGGLRQAMSELDRRVGLGSGGAVDTAARDVAMGESVTGRATFTVVADPKTGSIRSVRLRGWDGGQSDDWQRFADELKKHPVRALRAPDRAQGVWMVLQVSANNRPTSGHTSWFSPGVELSFDLADINSHIERVVQTYVLSEVWF